MWNRHKGKLIAAALVVLILAGAFWYGGSAPRLQGWRVDAGPPGNASNQLGEKDAGHPASPDTPGKTPDAPIDPAPVQQGTPSDDAPAGPEDAPFGGEDAAAPDVTAGDRDYSEANGMVFDPETGKDQYLTAPVPEGRPLPVEPGTAEITDTAYTCTLSISCATILDHMDWLDAEKTELVPEDGWILPATEVTFYEGESVFNVLQRACKQEKIHMEFSNTPMYNSAYIEGLHNLYEFDCGELSGWMYRVNGWFPNYGCSRYALQEGDTVEWVYTCDLGKDVGGYYATGGGE